jgi:hypothetical protein
MSLETEFHTALEHRVIEWCILQNATPLINFRLPTGRIPDLIYIDRNKAITIIEVKTCLTDCLLQTTLDKYRRYCDFLWIAAPTNEMHRTITDLSTYQWPRTHTDIGLLSVGERSVLVQRRAVARPLHSDTTLYLGWQIADRLKTTDITEHPNATP